MAQVDTPLQYAQWVDNNGYPTQFFYQFIHDLWTRTGGGSDAIEAIEFGTVGESASEARIARLENGIAEFGLAEILPKENRDDGDMSAMSKERDILFDRRYSFLVS